MQPVTVASYVTNININMHCWIFLYVFPLTVFVNLHIIYKNKYFIHSVNLYTAYSYNTCTYYALYIVEVLCQLCYYYILVHYSSKFIFDFLFFLNIDFYINLYFQNSITDQLKTCTHGPCNCTIQSFITGPYSRIIISLLFIHHILWAMKESVKSNWQHHQKTKPSIYSQEM